jgi:hypothetical protein
VVENIRRGNTGLKQIPLAMWSNAQVCGPSTAGVVGSNPAEHMVVRLVFFVCCLISGLCDELITRSEESYRVCVRACVCMSSGV